ncbi:hypothetical protein QQ045_014633 [Rhodiola kirilowii]
MAADEVKVAPKRECISRSKLFKGFCFSYRNCGSICKSEAFTGEAEKCVMVAEARPRVCQSQSHGFRGSCVSDGNCGQVCKNERFTGGKCRGFRRRCYCTKPC